MSFLSRQRLAAAATYSQNVYACAATLQQGAFAPLLAAARFYAAACSTRTHRAAMRVLLDTLQPTLLALLLALARNLSSQAHMSLTRG